MNKDKLLTKKDLAERWRLTPQTIDSYLRDGIIVAVKGIPAIRFNLQYIEKIEGRIPERTTTRERKLEKDIEVITNQRDYLKSALVNILNESSKVIDFLTSIEESKSC